MVVIVWCGHGVVVVVAKDNELWWMMIVIPNLVQMKKDVLNL